MMKMFLKKPHIRDRFLFGDLLIYYYNIEDDSSLFHSPSKLQKRYDLTNVNHFAASSLQSTRQSQINKTIFKIESELLLSIYE